MSDKESEQDKALKQFDKAIEELVTKVLASVFYKLVLALSLDEVKAVTLIFTKNEDDTLSVQLIPKKPEIEVIGENGQKRIISMFEIKSLEDKKRGDSE